jgi:hypothetical protein
MEHKMSEFSERVARGRGGYFKVADLEQVPGQQLTLQVSYLAENQAIGEQIKDIIYFDDDGRRLALNQPNAEACLDILGPEPLEWPGKYITLYLETYYDRQSGADRQRVAVRTARPEAKAPSSSIKPDSNGSGIVTSRPLARDLKDEIPF